MQLISPLGFNMPADLWYPAGNGIPPQRSDQFAIHFHYDYRNIESDLGFFRKKMNGLGEMATGAEMIAFTPLEAMVFGEGEAYGMEYGFKVHSGWLETGIFYTYSRTTRVIDEINNGEPFSPAFDLPHQVDLDMKGEIGRKWSWNLTWFYASGQVTTMPTGYAFLTHGPEKLPYPLYTERYNFRMPASHRMDISLVYNSDFKRGSIRLALGIYNLYHQSNPYYLYFIIEDTPGSGIEVVPQKMAIFPFTPFFSIKIGNK